MCPVILELKRQSNLECQTCITGQHKEMLEQIMTVFGLKPEYDLGIMKQGQSLSFITRSILEGMDRILETVRPDLVLVHGDTSSSFTAALSAFYHHIPIGHVEAGLRTYRMQSPYPEEFNRQAVDLISDLYFAPTQEARKQLLREGKEGRKIYVTGNTVIDALKTTVRSDYKNDNLEWAKGSKLLLLTAHRRENIGQPMVSIFMAVKKIVHDFPNTKVIYPIHKNPKVREIAYPILENNDRIRMIEPLNVFDFHNFISRSYLILTDSGGIQEEAPFLGKPVLVLRDTTERPEGVKAGTLKLVGTASEDIYAEAARLLTDEHAYQQMSVAVNPYGDGKAAERITGVIMEHIV